MNITFINQTKEKIPQSLIKKIGAAVKKIFKNHKFFLSELNFIFTNDKKIKEINKKYLGKNRPTDVIAFSYPENAGIKTADIFISLETAKKNSKIYQLTFKTEILILSIHGTLHLCGYEDRSYLEKKRMSIACLKILNSI
ncbi:MAG: rRNA maturation RNase YbeY [Elusimicrobiota bacterium]